MGFSWLSPGIAGALEAGAIERTLGEIHAPAFLGTRVVFEFCGAIAGVMIGWSLATVVPSGKRRART